MRPKADALGMPKSYLTVDVASEPRELTRKAISDVDCSIVDVGRPRSRSEVRPEQLPA